MKRKTYIETGVLFQIIGTGEEFHSFHDLNLVLAPFTYTPAKPKLNLVDLPGGDGTLDFTEALGEVKYNDREFTFTFSVFPQDDMTFEERQSFVSAALNGKRCKIILDKDCDFYWEGRCTVNEYLCDRRLCKIVVTATVKPYKMLRHETVVSYTLTGTAQTIILTNMRKTVIPVITCTDSVQVTVPVDFGAIGATLAAGTHKVPTFQLKRGNNEFRVTGTGTITFTYQEGEL